MDAARQLDQAAKRESCAWLSPCATVLIRPIRRNRSSNGTADPKVIFAASAASRRTRHSTIAYRVLLFSLSSITIPAYI